ncbi:uncharacterized protein LOC129751060 [Uranotaenia lowii]|uniref:uncharacterized protein LOC129751060 n=1 Tax=Uranotaenia lowii TaxID=190385 RepID=UPI00247A81C2|nr:uncharacterized protein LOC129751060 [Uranotaenia lowii]
MVALEIVLSNLHEAERTSGILMLSMFFGVTSMCYLLAFVSFVFIEKPCDVIVKQLLKPATSSHAAESTGDGAREIANGADAKTGAGGQGGISALRAWNSSGPESGKEQK